jgi:hypothetical protein
MIDSPMFRCMPPHRGPRHLQARDVSAPRPDVALDARRRPRDPRAVRILVRISLRKCPQFAKTPLNSMDFSRLWIWGSPVRAVASIPYTYQSILTCVAADSSAVRSLLRTFHPQVKGSLPRHEVSCAHPARTSANHPRSSVAFVPTYRSLSRAAEGSDERPDSPADAPPAEAACRTRRTARLAAAPDQARRGELSQPLCRGLRQGRPAPRASWPAPDARQPPR